LEEIFVDFLCYVHFWGVEHKQQDGGAKTFLALGFTVPNIKTMELGDQMSVG
jgi:hypothetical protein